MKKMVILAAIAAITFVGCAGTEDTKKLPGMFAVQADNSRSVIARNAATLGPYQINTARTVYFYLKNIGDFPITGIELSLGKHGSDFEPVANNDFAIFPATISQLAPSNTSSVDTFIELNINHGHIIGAIAQPNVIKNGVEGVTVRITGMTNDDGGNAIPVSLDVNVDMDIKVASFEIHYSEDEGMNYTKAEVDESASFKIPLAGKDYIKILNTGNVPLRYKVERWEDMTSAWESNVHWINIESGSYSNALIYGYGMSIFIIDTIGVIFDNDGIENLVFRPDTSIIINNINPNLNGMIFYFY
ncbi:MAG: hypothetical protein FWC09_08345 [Lachnospiraceae bacterium]|nr:hypothetical protein [Lachnospiraceae bacterium]